MPPDATFHGPHSFLQCATTNVGLSHCFKRECGRGYRYCEVVQLGQGIWIYSARYRRKDVFVHISAVEKAGLGSLNEGAKVSYEVVANRGKELAENLRVG